VPMKTLDEIAIEHGTDKSTSHPLVCEGRGHGYTLWYEHFFEPMREMPLKFMEIGVGGGESIRTWLEYFPNAHIVGVDIVHDTNEYNTPGNKSIPRYTFVTGDQNSETFWACFKADYGSDWDVLIDDGGHSSQMVITTFKCMWPGIKPGGLYCIEDLCCSYASIPYFCPEGWANHMDLIKEMLDDINRGQRSLRRIHYTRELAIIQKSYV